jgi:hypothetical protein
MDRDTMEHRYLNSTDTSIPTYFTIDPPTESILFRPIPDAVYVVSLRYQKSPETLTSASQVPSLPLSFHTLITYMAVEKLSVYLGSPEIFRNYSAASSKLMGQLMRDDLPKKRFNGRPFV